MKEQEELELFRKIIEVTGDVLFTYDIATDTIEYLSCRNGMQQGGYTINGYVSMLRRQFFSINEASRMEEYFKNLQNEEIKYFECDVNLRNYTNEQHLYHVMGKKEYNDGKAIKVIGKMTPENEIAATRATEERRNDEAAKTGMLRGAEFRTVFVNKCAELNGKNGVYLSFSVESLDKLCEGNQDLLASVLISIGQTIRRNYSYDVIIGRISSSQYAVVYYGYKIVEFIEKLDTLKSQLESISVGDNTIKINGGVYFGPFSEDNAYEISEKAHIALTSAKCRDENVFVMYSKHLENALREKEYSQKGEIDNLHFEHLLMEKIMDVILENGKVQKVLTEIFTKISNRYEIDRIIVFENDVMDSNDDEAYYWTYLENVVMPMKISNSKKDIYNSAFEMCAEDGVMVIQDSEELSEVSEFSGNFGNAKLQSFVGTRYELNDTVTVNVSFESYSTKHKWKKSELRTLRFITRIVSAYINNAKEHGYLEEDAEEIKDALTGLFQYEYFLEEADKYIKKHTDEKLVLVYTGIHNFVNVNSKHGFKKGDEVLKSYAELMSNAEKRYIIGTRISADNYVMLASEFDSHGNSISDMAVNGYCKAFEQLYKNELEDCDLSVYSGVAKVEDVRKPAEDYVKQAHIARKIASEAGKNIHFI